MHDPLHADALDALYAEPDYSGIAKDCSLTIDITAEQSAAVLKAFDMGFALLTEKQEHDLSVVIAKLKNQIWP